MPWQALLDVLHPEDEDLLEQAMNAQGVSPEKYSRLLAMIHPDLRWKFNNFTAEELFYAIRLLSRKKLDRLQHQFHAKLVIYLRDLRADINPLSIDQWRAAGRDWTEDYLFYLALPELATQEQVEMLKQKWSATA